MSVPGQRAGYLSSRYRAANPPSTQAVQRRHLEADVAPLLPGDPDAPILEIGFGLGGALDYLSERGFTRYEGVEVDAEAFAAVRGRHPVQLSDDVPAFLAERPETYELIMLFAVVSHLERPEAVHLLGAVRDALRPGGRVIVETFNSALPSGFYTFANDLTHRTPFTEHSLRQLLLLAGLGDVEVAGARPTAGTGARGRLYVALRRAYLRAVAAAFDLERGRGNQPAIWDKVLFATARR